MCASAYIYICPGVKISLFRLGLLYVGGRGERGTTWLSRKYQHIPSFTVAKTQDSNSPGEVMGGWVQKAAPALSGSLFAGGRRNCHKTPTNP